MVPNPLSRLLQLQRTSAYAFPHSVTYFIIKAPFKYGAYRLRTDSVVIEGGGGGGPEISRVP